jgi:hypothetical protein
LFSRLPGENLKKKKPFLLVGDDKERAFLQRREKTIVVKTSWPPKYKAPFFSCPSSFTPFPKFFHHFLSK